jgi:metal-sulfur cluster biosynthetic enzyme
MSGGRDLWSDPLHGSPTDPEGAVRACLSEVLDPEIPISLIDLGLIYGVAWDSGRVTIRVSYTATACPCMEFIREDIRDRLEREPWIREVEIVDVWDPPWTRERITPRGRIQLRELGVGA